MAATSIGALFKDQIPIEVAVVVFPIFDELAVFVGLSLLWSPAVEVFVETDANHLIRREEAVGDALAKGVDVDGFAEVFDIGNVPGLLGSGGEPDLGGRGEVFEHLPPRGVLGGAATVALVHNDEIEEVG